MLHIRIAKEGKTKENVNECNTVLSRCRIRVRVEFAERLRVDDNQATKTTKERVVQSRSPEGTAATAEGTTNMDTTGYDAKVYIVH